MTSCERASQGNELVVRYREGDRNRSRLSTSAADADRFDAEVIRRRQLGELAALDAGRETLDEFVTQTWAPTFAVTLAPKTRQHTRTSTIATSRRILGGVTFGS